MGFQNIEYITVRFLNKTLEKKKKSMRNITFGLFIDGHT